MVKLAEHKSVLTGNIGNEVKQENKVNIIILLLLGEKRKPEHTPPSKKTKKNRGGNQQTQITKDSKFVG